MCCIWRPTGSGDAFSLQLPRLGSLAKARLWLEGPGSPWHLQLLVVTGPDGESVCRFLFLGKLVVHQCGIDTCLQNMSMGCAMAEHLSVKRVCR